MEFHDPLANSPRFSSGALGNLSFHGQMFSILVVPQRGTFFLTGNTLFLVVALWKKYPLTAAFVSLGRTSRADLCHRDGPLGPICVTGTDRPGQVCHRDGPPKEVEAAAQI